MSVPEHRNGLMMTTPSEYGGNKMKQFTDSVTRKVEVDNRLSIKVYYRMANNILNQASIYRDENNIIDLYILLLRFASLVTDTIPEHRDYQLEGGLRVEYRKRLIQIINELESLKPEVQKQIQTINFAPSNSSPPAPSLTYNSGLSRPAYIRSQPYLTTNVQKDYTQVGSSNRRDYFNRPANTESPVFNPSYLEDPSSTLSFSIPRAKDETLSRHTILGSVSQTNRRSPIRPVKVQYPSYVNASPIELPSLQQSRNTAAPRLSTGDSSLDLDSSPWPKSDTTAYTTDPNLLGMIRQPSAPPMHAAVQAMSIADVYDRSNMQRRPSEVADPRPGPPRSSKVDFSESKGPKNLHISTKLLEEFLELAKLNTEQNLETCGILTGSLEKGVFYITTLIIPKQESTSDHCQTLNEEEIFDTQDKRGLFQLGWIHTHPKQTCFMSSVDLHTHYSYQVMLPEAIAIVMAPTDTSRKFGIFRLSDPGVKVLQNCQKRGFHPHEEPPEGGPIYEHSSHVLINPKLRFDVVDLR